MAAVVVFIVTMDILKYGFRIDPVHKQVVKKKREAPVSLRFLYVDPMTLQASDLPSTSNELYI